MQQGAYIVPTYHNPTSETLTFDIAQDHFRVPPGDECEIPRVAEYVVAARGLPLVKGHSPKADAKFAEATDVKVPKTALPPGIENPATPGSADSGDAVDEEPGDDSGEGEGAESVDAAAKELAARGVKLPKRAK